MPRPKIFGAQAARKKRARKPWTLQRTIFNTFIAFIYLLPSFTSVFSGIVCLLFLGPTRDRTGRARLIRRTERVENCHLRTRNPRVLSFSLFSAPLTRTFLPSADPATAVPAQEPFDAYSMNLFASVSLSAPSPVVGSCS